MPDDLAQVVDAWANLPKPVQAGILAMIDEAFKATYKKDPIVNLVIGAPMSL